MIVYFFSTHNNINFITQQGSYSPGSNMISTAKIRTTSQKESKEKQNRERLLAGPGSEFSLANPEELEMDYYDYNVTNAGAAPGSYLGMDPAYLVWIPPIDEGNILSEMDNDDNDDEDGDEVDDGGSEREHHYEEILPRADGIDPGSNTETPDDETVPELPIKQIINKSNLNYQKIAASTLKNELPCKKITNNFDIIQLDEYPINNKGTNRYPSPAKIHLRKTNDNLEKETAVVKSPSDNINDYYELDDIQFADDDDDDDGDGEMENVNRTKVIHIKT